MTPRVGFIGLGVMGLSMAGHLGRSFGGVTVWNRTVGKAAALEGATIAASPAALAESCDIVCICVADTPDVEQVVFDPFGVYTSLGKGKLVIDFSTISASATEGFSTRVRERGGSWLDAPVSGGDVGARNATLSVMVGGAEEDFHRALPLFEAVGKNIHYMGSSGNGQRTKMANQIAVCGTIASMAEAMVFAQKSGMDVGKVLAAISGGAAGSWSLSNYGPRVLSGDFAPGFSARLMAKDLRLVAEALEKLDVECPVTELMHGIFEAMAGRGQGSDGVQGSVRDFGWSP